MQFRPVHRLRAFEQICDQVRVHLEQGELRPGDRLPAEQVLAAQFGVGRNALREALRGLEIAGLLERRQGSNGGTFIKGGDPTRMGGVLRDLLSVGSISIEALAEARLHVLDLVVRLASQRAVEADFEALEANIEVTRVRTEENRFLERIECSGDFYRLLGEATQNPVVGLMLHGLSEILMQFVHARMLAGGKPYPRLVETRRAIMAAIRMRDAELAGRLMRRHLDGVHRNLARLPRKATGRAV